MIIKKMITAAVVSILSLPVLAERINHTISVLEKGGAAFGTFSSDTSLTNARSMTRSALDFVFIDMEHGPYDTNTLHNFLLGMTDKKTIAETGSLKMGTTPIVRVPVNGREMNQFITKQVLDLGAFGIMFPMINTREQAEWAIAASRFPQARGAKDSFPVGLRGKSPVNAAWYWGLGFGEYVERADAWPLDPNGEILVVIQIESPQAVENIEEIISVPGVGAIFVGPADLSANMGLPSNDPEVEAAIQTVLKSCIKHNIACGITTGSRSVENRIKQGFRFVTVGGYSAAAAVSENLAKGRKAAGRD